jgi:hypothetical protein
VAHDHAQLDWPASSSSYPIRWRPAELRRRPRTEE